jgi:hypothetical protein
VGEVSYKNHRYPAEIIAHLRPPLTRLAPRVLHFADTYQADASAVVNGDD